MTPPLEPFALDVPEATLEDLARRLAQARLPGEPANAAWDYGTSLTYLGRLLAYWRTEFDWRAVEARLNRLPQFIVGPLAHPERFGGRVEDAFDVVVPSLPGYGWSEARPAPIGTREIARIWDELMTSLLGYPRYVAQGGDWGSLVSSWLGLDAAERVAAIHLNMMGLRPYLGEGSPPLTAEEADWVARTRARLARETGYQAIQGTKPQTLAYALTDSPIGLAAWIAEKFHGWSGPGPDGPPFTMEQIIGNVMVYWLTGSANSASWLYTAARRLPGMRLRRGELIVTPTAFLCAPHDLFPPPPDSWIRRVYHCVRRTDLPEGGHFLAYERPVEFVEDVRAFFRDYRIR